MSTKRREQRITDPDWKDPPDVDEARVGDLYLGLSDSFYLLLALRRTPSGDLQTEWLVQSPGERAAFWRTTFLSPSPMLGFRRLAGRGP